MRLTLLSGAEVGEGTSLLLNIGNKRILIDCGLSTNPILGVYSSPKLYGIRNIDLVLLTHAHPTSAGALPRVINTFPEAAVIATESTAKLLKLFLADSQPKVSGMEQDHCFPSYPPDQIKTAFRNLFLAQTNRRIKPFADPSIELELRPAGHLPGAVSYEISYRHERILIAGDCTAEAGYTFPKMEMEGLNPQVMVINGAYAGHVLPSRKTQEQAFLDLLEVSLSRGGSVLIPVSALGRAQEILGVIGHRQAAYPNLNQATIWLDGGVKTGTSFYQAEGLIGQKELSRVRMVDLDDRDELARMPGNIILTTSSHLGLGLTAQYLRSMMGSPKNTLLLTRQADEESSEYQTNLAKGESLHIGGKSLVLLAQVLHYELGSHLHTMQMAELIRQMGASDIVLINRNTESQEVLGQLLAERTLHSPAVGDYLDFNDRGSTGTRSLALVKPQSPREDKPVSFVTSFEELVSKLPHLQKTLGYTFRNPNLLIPTLTHRSVTNLILRASPDSDLAKWVRGKAVPSLHMERSEFLGDAVIEIAVTEVLYRRLPDQPEGVLTDLRTSIVCGVNLAIVANQLGLLNYIWLSQGQQEQYRKDPIAARRVAANLMESVIGAVYLDRGMEAAQVMVDIHIIPPIGEILRRIGQSDPKSQIQEYAQSKLALTPTYEMVGEGGSDHEKWFEAVVRVGIEEWGRGIGRSKQEAQVSAAEQALHNRANYPGQ